MIKVGKAIAQSLAATRQKFEQKKNVILRTVSLNLS